MPLIEPGQKAPAFTLNDQHGKTHRLSDYAGRPVILYFYPKDDTPGCTKESCAFQDNLPKFKSSKAAVLGVSILDEASKARFADKYKLTFPLLADAEHESRRSTAPGRRRSNYGRSYMGIARTTYLIGRRRQGRETLGQRQGRRPRRGGPRRGQRDCNHELTATSGRRCGLAPACLSPASETARCGQLRGHRR